jgi:hypothetical protein
MTRCAKRPEGARKRRRSRVALIAENPVVQASGLRRHYRGYGEQEATQLPSGGPFGDGRACLLERGQLSRARAMLSEALSTAKELGSPRVVAGCISAMGAVAAAADQLHDSARLVGAARGLRRSIEIVTERFEAELEHATLSSLAMSLAPKALDQSVREGEALPADQAITQAVRLGNA